MGHFFAFDGRTSRLGYFRVQLVLYALSFPTILVFVEGLLGVHADLPAKDIPAFVPKLAMSEPVAGVTLAIGALMLILLVWLLMAVEVRRLHDLGLTGWAVLLSFIVAKAVPDPKVWSDYLPSLGSLVWNVFMLLIPGQRGANRYGEDPLAKPADAVEP